MNWTPSRSLPPLGVLLSGGLDSSILLATLVAGGRPVHPFYIRTDLVWAEAELLAVDRFLKAIASPNLAPLRTFELPLADLYDDHWSLSGRQTPDATSPEDAVLLPGRNALLAIKPLLWCQAHGIEELALAVLAGNPFADARPEFFDLLQAAVGAGGPRVRITRPFSALRKDQVLQLGRGLPLADTFSCIAPRDGLHCGRCNKCAERRQGFAAAELPDPTRYCSDRAAPPHDHRPGRRLSDVPG